MILCRKQFYTFQNDKIYEYAKKYKQIILTEIKKNKMYARKYKQASNHMRCIGYKPERMLGCIKLWFIGLGNHNIK
jgi:hypothetical protein